MAKLQDKTAMSIKNYDYYAYARGEHMRTEVLVAASPDQNVELKVYLGDFGQDKKMCFYEVLYKKRTMIRPSVLGLRVEGHEGYSKNLVAVESKISKVEHEWRPLFWDRDLIEDNYTECKITFDDQVCPDRCLEIMFRVYNEGVAFSYCIPEQAAIEALKIIGEYSSFSFPEGCIAYEEHGSEGCYSEVPVSSVKGDCERPLTVVYPEGLYAAILEAGTNDYARMLLSASQTGPDTLEVSMNGVLTGFVGYGDASPLDDPEWSNGHVEGKTPFKTPWRLIVLGERPGECFRSGLSTGEGKACVDFAAEHNMQYIEFDAGWYGHEYDDASDARAVNLDPGRVGHIKNHEGLDLQEVIRGNEHMPTATHNTILPFTRCIAGPADYTVCYYSERIKTTRAHQLAMSVVIFSPLQFLYWYDSPNAYNGEPEIEFFDRVPTVWDETKVYTAQVFADGDDKKDVGCINITNLDKNSQLEVAMAASGGQALIIEPM